MNVTQPNRDLLIRTAKLCPYCEGIPQLVNSNVVYGPSADYGKVWRCECGAYVGCHPGTSRPLGRVADKVLRYWKNRAHEAFDPLWKRATGRGRRVRAYAWLGREMGTAKEATHIGMFDIEQCQRVVAICAPYLKRSTINQ